MQVACGNNRPTLISNPSTLAHTVKTGDKTMKDKGRVFTSSKNRRAFLKNGIVAAGAATVGAAILDNGLSAFGKGHEERSGSLTPGDAAILRFLAAAEILETDLWVQYNELGGIQDSEVPGGSGS